MPSYRLQDIRANGEALDFDSATLNVHSQDCEQWWIQVRTNKPVPEHFRYDRVRVDVLTATEERFSGTICPADSPHDLTGGRRTQKLIVLQGEGGLHRAS